MLTLGFELGPASTALVTRLVVALETISKGVDHMALDFTDLTAKVAKIDGAVESAVAAFKAIADELSSAAGDQAKVAQLAADLDSHADALAAAIPAKPTP